MGEKDHNSQTLAIILTVYTYSCMIYVIKLPLLSELWILKFTLEKRIILRKLQLKQVLYNSTWVGDLTEYNNKHVYMSSSLKTSSLVIGNMFKNVRLLFSKNHLKSS